MKVKLLKNVGVTANGQPWLLAGEEHDFDEVEKAELLTYLLGTQRAIPVKEEAKKQTAVKKQTNREKR